MKPPVEKTEEVGVQPLRPLREALRRRLTQALGPGGATGSEDLKLLGDGGEVRDPGPAGLGRVGSWGGVQASKPLEKRRRRLRPRS